MYVQQDSKSLWKPAIVTEIPSDYKSCSYTVQTEDGSQLRCNRRFIKPNVVPQHQPDKPETTPVSAQTTPVVRPQCNAARPQRLVEENKSVHTSPGTSIAANLDTLQESTQQCRTL